MIVRRSFREYSLEFAVPARDAHGSRSRTRGALLRLESTTGRVGYGELCPLPGRSRETLAECRAALERLPLAELPSPERCQAPSFRSELARASALLPEALPAARHALESALVDLFAQREPAPSFLARVFGSPAPRETLPVAALVDASSVAGALEQARTAIASGAAALKLKISANEEPSAIVARVEALRRELGDGVKLRLDANQSLSVSQAQDLGRALAPFDIEFLEDALPFEQLAALGAARVPLAADEWLLEPGFEPEGARLLGVRVLVIKPMLLGLLGSWRWSERAREAGLEVVISHSFDGPLAMATARALALVLGRRPFADGLAAHAALAAWPEPLPLHVTAARVEPWTLPGWGVTVSDRP